MLNLLCCILYFIASGFLIPRVDAELKFLYYTVSEFSAYHYLNFAIACGFIAGSIHFIDFLCALCELSTRNR